jgi:hypothetical protein
MIGHVPLGFSGLNGWIVNESTPAPQEGMTWVTPPAALFGTGKSLSLGGGVSTSALLDTTLGPSAAWTIDFSTYWPTGAHVNEGGDLLSVRYLSNPGTGQSELLYTLGVSFAPTSPMRLYENSQYEVLSGNLTAVITDPGTYTFDAQRLSMPNGTKAVGTQYGKKYIEVVHARTTGNGTAKGMFGLLANNRIDVTTGAVISENFFGDNAYLMNGIGAGGASIGLVTNGAQVSNGAYNYNYGDVIGIAVDFSTGQIWYSKNGAWIVGDPATGTSPSHTLPNANYQFVSTVYLQQETNASYTVAWKPTAVQQVHAAPAGFTPYGGNSAPPDTAAYSLAFVPGTMILTEADVWTRWAIVLDPSTEHMYIYKNGVRVYNGAIAGWNWTPWLINRVDAGGWGNTYMGNFSDPFYLDELRITATTFYTGDTYELTTGPFLP